MRLLPLIVALLACFSLARADTPSVVFDDGRYALSFEDQATLPDGEPGDGIAEFTLAGESVDNWSKLFAFHAYPEMGDDPVAAVETLGKIVKENNKDANYAIITNDESGEAMIDFLTWAPESDVMEFNVFKYARSADGRGLIAMQFAQHVKLGELDVDGMRALRVRAVDAMAATDMAQAQAYFANKRSTSASKAPEEREPALARAGRDD
ncbi:MAG: hypothetical protein M5U16_12045 [Hyphomicrobium sp.]|nr:hypothetical protein [Hyphomicrobium sp.]